MNAHVEEFRERLVSHEGKKELVKISLESSPERVDWTDFVERISLKVQECILDGDLRTWMIPDFSTTTSQDRVAGGVALLSSMQRLFSYTEELMCGLPSVTLLGARADYESILQRVQKLRDMSFGSEPSEFADLLEPVVKRLIRSFDEPAAADVIDFWSRIFTAEKGGSGPVPWSGWLTAFMFWGKDGKIARASNNMFTPSHKAKTLVLDKVEYPKRTNDNLPPGFILVPIKIILPDFSEIDAEMLAGSIGIKASKSKRATVECDQSPDTMQPVVGWLIYNKKPDSTNT